MYAELRILVLAIAASLFFSPAVLATGEDAEKGEGRSYFFYEAYGNIFYTTTDFLRKDSQVDKDISPLNIGMNGYHIRMDNLRLGLVLPLPNPDRRITIDPYIGGQIYAGSNDTNRSLFLAPAIGARIKFLSLRFLFPDSESSKYFNNEIFDFFESMEFFFEKRCQVYEKYEKIGNDKRWGKDSDKNKNIDTVYGLKMYKEYYYRNVFWQFFSSFLYYNNAWQDDNRPVTPIFYSPGWLFQGELLAGCNIKDYLPTEYFNWNFGPYIRLEVFKTFSENEFVYWYNRYITAVGIHFRNMLPKDFDHTRWIDLYVEYAYARYFKYSSKYANDTNIMGGVKLWVQ